MLKTQVSLTQGSEGRRPMKKKSSKKIFLIKKKKKRVQYYLADQHKKEMVFLSEDQHGFLFNYLLVWNMSSC